MDFSPSSLTNPMHPLSPFNPVNNSTVEPVQIPQEMQQQNTDVLYFCLATTGFILFILLIDLSYTFYDSRRR